MRDEHILIPIDREGKGENMAENVSSLARRCLETIAESIALRCRDERLIGDSIYPDSAISQLSDSTVQEILDLAFSKEILSPEYFALLIHKNVLKLDLSRYMYRYQQLITDQVLLQLTCKKLVSLNLRGLEVSSSCLNQIMQNFTFLTVINLSHCRGCSDSVLENLAKHCPNVKDLNVEWCSQITDHGMEALVRPAVSSLQHLKIAYFNVSSTSVTTESLWMLLNSLPLLLSLSFARINGTGKSVADHTMFNTNVQLQLQHLDILGTTIGFNQLKLVLEGFPNLIELKLTIPFCKNDYADSFETFSESLKNLSKLKSLHISILDEPRSQSFPFERIGSFLQQNGHQLESLNLAGPIELSLLVVCLYCSSLKQLVLNDCQLVQPFLPSLETSPKEHCEANTGCNISMFSDFCSLEYIDLEKVKFKDISLHQKQELLYHLLAFLPHLLQLSLKRVPIEENVLIKFLQTSSGVHLEKLVLSCYDNITAKTIHAIKEICPNLKRLELFHCWDITWYDIWNINDRLKRNGRKLEVIIPEQNNLII